MKDKDKVRLQHIRDAIIELESFTSAISSSEFQENRLVRNASVRSLEVIGEAIAALSNDVRKDSNNFPWQDWKDFRNVLIHQYFGVDYSMVYNAIKKDVPSLKCRLP